ncbi:MAG: histidine phosphatase family protein [Proteobacteria bacterium]|nr:MAG: histidine phosphatase family protein [Pseudomonadota bacterium]
MNGILGFDLKRYIYILRHFKVKDFTCKKLNSREFEEWEKSYDDGELECLHVEIPKPDKVYVSEQKRALKTAQYLKLKYEKTSLLKEVEACAFMKTNLKFSKNFWLLTDRLLWFLNLKKGENRKDTAKRAIEFLDKIDETKSVLIISHGLFISVLIKELEKRGFRGKKDLHAKNGKLYHFWYV